MGNTVFHFSLFSENYWRLLDECKEISLSSSFKEIKKLVRDDPRYSKYSSSDRKCEKQFNEYMKVSQSLKHLNLVLKHLNVKHECACSSK